MKFRNGWNTYTKQWDKLAIKVRFSFIDNSTNAFTITRNGDAKVSALQQFGGSNLTASNKLRVPKPVT